MLAGALLASFASLAYAINPLQINGTKFFESTGAQFFIKGVAYQPVDANQTAENAITGATINDPLADSVGCSQAVSLMTALGVNVIRTYQVNASLDHDACMETFANAGIYLFVDLETPDSTIVSDDPTWTVSQYEAFTATVDAFVKYENTAGFFIGNEVVNAYNVSSAAPFVKAAGRDMRAYISSKGYRAIPVGYAGADVVGLQIQLAEFLSCGDDTDGLDFYGINVYSWCGNSTYTESGYDILESEYTNLTRPVFFSEFGCNIPVGETRTFGDIPSLYGVMADVFSGGIVYEWIEDTNSYGLVTSASAGASPTPLADYTVLSSRWAAVSPSSTSLADYVGTTRSVSCPANTSGFVAATSLPPTPDSAYCSCEAAAAKCSASSGSASAIESAFAIVCGVSSSACSIVDVNGTSPGAYGEYSFCSGQQQLALVYQAYYSAQSSVSSACGFTLATLVASPAAASTCSHDAVAEIASGVAVAASGSAGKTTTGTKTSSTSTSTSSSSTSSFGMRSADFSGMMLLAGSVVLGGVAFIVL